MSTADGAVIPGVLVVGGYGVVGAQISQLLAERHPDLGLLIGGRNLQHAVSAAQRWGGEGVRIDVEDEDPLERMTTLPTVVVVAVNDHDDRLLLSAARRGIAVIDIARWESRVKDAHTVLADETMRAPVVLASGWLAGLAATSVAAFRSGSMAALQVDVDILFALADKAGPDSVTAFVDIDQPFQVCSGGELLTVRGMSDPRTVRFGDRVARCYRMSSPDQMTLVRTGHADGVSVRMAFDSAAVTALMATLVRSGIWARLPRSLRRRLLHNPGNGAGHEVLITIDDVEGGRRILVSDPMGQTHATAAAAVTQVERVLEAPARGPVPNGISYPEESADPTADVEALRAMGVGITRL
jgi:saccharopine dehydrogenase-like NADP-dependent oxidoreductase